MQWARERKRRQVSLIGAKSVDVPCVKKVKKWKIENASQLLEGKPILHISHTSFLWDQKGKFLIELVPLEAQHETQISKEELSLETSFLSAKA